MNTPYWIVSDLDDTLLLADATLSDKTLSTIENIRSKGVKFGIATTRSPHLAQIYIDQLKPDLAVLSGGSLGYMGSSLRYTRLIELAQVKEIVDSVVKTLSPKRVVIDTLGGRIESRGDFLKEDALSLFIWLENSKEVALLKEISDGLSLTPLWEPHMFRISHPEATKEGALKSLLSNYHPKEILCFGDDRMDVGMLSHFRGVAVANALSEAIEAATEITLSNKEEGVASFLEHLYCHK